MLQALGHFLELLVFAILALGIQTDHEIGQPSRHDTGLGVIAGNYIGTREHSTTVENHCKLSWPSQHSQCQHLEDSLHETPAVNALAGLFACMRSYVHAYLISASQMLDFPLTSPHHKVFMRCGQSCIQQVFGQSAPWRCPKILRSKISSYAHMHTHVTYYNK